MKFQKGVKRKEVEHNFQNVFFSKREPKQKRGFFDQTLFQRKFVGKAFF